MTGIISLDSCDILLKEDASYANKLEKFKKAACDNEVVFVDMQPPNNDYWTDPETWEYRIECKTAFEWFIGDETHYIKKLQNYVRDWKQERTLKNHKIDVLKEKFYFLEQCEVGELSGDAVIICKNSTIRKMRGNSKIISMHGCSYVDEMSGNSSITIAMDKCCVHRMCNTTQIQSLRGYARVSEMLHNSTIQTMLENSRIGNMHGESIVRIMHNHGIVEKMFGDAIVNEMWGWSCINEMRDYSIVFHMRQNSSVNEMHERSTVVNMHNASKVGKLYDSAIAREQGGRIILVPKGVKKKVPRGK